MGFRLFFPLALCLVSLGILVYVFNHGADAKVTQSLAQTQQYANTLQPTATPSPQKDLSSPTHSNPVEKSAYALWLDASTESKTTSNRFYKVNMDGELLPNDASYWTCVYDRVYGLLWEVKRQDGSWQDSEHTYSWYDPPVDGFGLTQQVGLSDRDISSGHADAGQCYAIPCDTYSYQSALNEEWLCSTNAWRLPFAHELALLDHPEHYYPDIDTQYFPNTATGHYWSQTQVPNATTLAWSVDFKNGFPYITEKRIAYHLRLVSDAPWLSKAIDQNK